MAEQKVTSSGIGLGGAIFIVFLVLKLTGTIDWSWWWVTAPIWTPIVLAVIAFAIYVVYAVCMVKKRKSKFQQRMDKFKEEQEKLLREKREK